MTSKSDYPSTLSLQSTTTVSSTTPLRVSQRPPQKDYAAAFGTLQSRYGTGASIPNPKKEPSKKLPSNLSSVLEATTTPQSSQTTIAPPSITSEGSESTGSTSTSGDPDRKKSKQNKSFLKSLFKGKAKE
ncbi:hypothetical protein B0H34DRAFT_797829 [Crassisporium funariophilum]|nr:hypothetical protein B0H34DRAFT_797829 [Crassisporium funariophilum]